MERIGIEPSTERYAHLVDDARKTMADAVSETIARRSNQH